MKFNNLQYNTPGRWAKRLINQVLFFFIISYRFRALKTFYFYLCKFIKKIEKYNERIFANNFVRNHEKKKTLGTSDTWLSFGGHLSHRPSDPAYYIEDFRISTVCVSTLCFKPKEYAGYEATSTDYNFFIADMRKLQRQL
jgi:hypothetical protein